MATATTYGTLSTTEHRSHLRKAIIASTIGTTIEWYDFFLYGTAAGLIFGKLYFPNEDPLGKRIRSWRDENKLREIVGVVADVRYFGREDEPRGLVYVPHTQNSWRAMALNVRTQSEPSAVVGAIRNQIKAVDKDLAVANIKTMSSILARSDAPRSWSMLSRASGAGSRSGWIACRPTCGRS